MCASHGTQSRLGSQSGSCRTAAASTDRPLRSVRARVDTAVAVMRPLAFSVDDVGAAAAAVASARTRPTTCIAHPRPTRARQGQQLPPRCAVRATVPGAPSGATGPEAQPSWGCVDCPPSEPRGEQFGEKSTTMLSRLAVAAVAAGARGARVRDRCLGVGDRGGGCGRCSARSGWDVAGAAGGLDGSAPLRDPRRRSGSLLRGCCVPQGAYLPPPHGPQAVVHRIEKRRQQALLGGGLDRIESQHKRVRPPPVRCACTAPA
jgi:hypothetical protein